MDKIVKKVERLSVNRENELESFIDQQSAARGKLLDSHQSKFSPGDHVVVQTVHRKAITGTVRWVGSVRAADNVTVPAVVGIEVVSSYIK